MLAFLLGVLLLLHTHMPHQNYPADDCISAVQMLSLL
jgi:hypothetical protein